ncbi:MAG: GlsB/YeaQ/YmgE family stress response membrane protein [Pseudobdellovibrio sp.]
MIWALIIGLFVGAIAKFIMPGRDGGGIIVTALLGVAGAMLAGWIGSSAGYYQPHEPVGLIASVLGAMLILFIYRLATGKSRV